MKKIIFILILGLTLTSCLESNIDRKVTKTTYGSGFELEEMTYDGCQYIGYFNGSNCDWGTHKGNCTNPIHKQSKVTIVDTVEYKLIKQ